MKPSEHMSDKTNRNINYTTQTQSLAMHLQKHLRPYFVWTAVSLVASLRFADYLM